MIIFDIIAASGAISSVNQPILQTVFVENVAALDIVHFLLGAYCV